MTTADDEEITQYTCSQCRLPIAEADPFEYLVDGRPAHAECFDRYNAGRPPVAAVHLCPEVHETHGRCVMFEGHQGRHRTRSLDGRVLHAWWSPGKGAA